MYLSLFNNLFSSVSGFLRHFQGEVTALIVFLAIAAGCWQTARAVWEGGVEQASRVGRHSAGVVLFVLLLCASWPGIGSVLGNFPAQIIRAGFGTANVVLAGAPGEFSGSNIDNVANKIEKQIKKNREDFLTTWNRQIGEVRQAYTDGRPVFLDPGFWYFIILQLLLFVVIAVPAALFCSVCPLLFIPGLLTLWFFAGMVAGEVTGFPLAKDPIFSLTVTCIDYFALGTSDFIFYALSFFSFAIMMIMTCVRATIFCVLFPISAVTLPFERRRSVFFNNVWRVFSYALTPVVLGVVLVICVSAYSTLSEPGGILQQLRETFMGAPPSLPKTDFSSGVSIARAGVALAGDLLEYLCKAVAYVLLGPATLSLVALKCLWTAPKMLDEILGAGVQGIDARIPGGQAAAHAAQRVV